MIEFGDQQERASVLVPGSQFPTHPVFFADGGKAIAHLRQFGTALIHVERHAHEKAAGRKVVELLCLKNVSVELIQTGCNGRDNPWAIVADQLQILTRRANT